ncbi:MAG TPA: ATP-dependent zinc metalloprotease FtsH, partial [Gemmatimonadaceae bacterium]|nr:ATP-dependent zinc metalloprotease FtsH [Gemmatimonadaceae bacterium]
VRQIYSRGESITGQFATAVTYPAPGDTTTRVRTPRAVTKFATTLPSFVDPGFETLLISNGVNISAEPIDTDGNPYTTFLFGFGPVILIMVFYIWMYRRAKRGGGIGGALTGLGKSSARRFDKEQETRVTFEDVAGIDEAENELVEIVDFLRNPEKYTRLGGAAPKGVLLIGAPGTGKTLLARAVAGEANVPFFSMSAAEFIEMIVGVGAARVRDLFRQAREQAPAIIFIDELDSIGRARGQTAIGGSSEQEQTLNQILTEMDGFSSREGIIVLAATNQPDILDKALLRPGRFDRRVVVNLPDRNGREAILKVHTRRVPLAPDVNLTEIASATPGLSGADLKNLVNEAALLAARREQNDVRPKDFLDALEKIVLGPERPLLMSRQDRERIAYHEGGHAILGLVVAGADPVHRVTIVPRGQALGVTYQRPDSDRYNYPEPYLRSRIVGMLGGRAAEEIVYGTKTTGAQNDIEQATSLARSMVTRWGMSERLGLVQLAPRENPYLASLDGYGGPKSFSEETARTIDAEVLRIISESHADALRLLTEHRPALDALANALLARETLDEQEILQVTGLAAAPALAMNKL